MYFQMSVDKNCIATPTNATSVTNLGARTTTAPALPSKETGTEAAIPHEITNNNTAQIPVSPNKRAKHSTQQVCFIQYILMYVKLLKLIINCMLIFRILLRIKQQRTKLML